MLQFGELTMLQAVSWHVSYKKYIKVLSFALVIGVLNIMILVQSFAADAQPKAVWYRYYDKGVANISSTVTPAHIRHGYEALDANMQVIRRNRPYSAEKDAQQSTARAAQAKQNEQNARLKRAYGNSSVAINKRNEQLASIKKQISLQQTQVKQLQNDRILLKRQEMEHFRKGSTVPIELKQSIQYNSDRINQTKKNIEVLQNNYQKTQDSYNSIIQRLKAME